MRILVIDNYDSFTYNLVQLLGRYNNEIIIKRNDEISIGEIITLNPSKILISPGPGRPENSGISIGIIKKLTGKIPVLGVCLGHQAIGYCFGGKITSASKLMHGKVSTITHDKKTIYKNIPQGFAAARYHSLIIERKSLPDDLEISAETQDGIIMGIRHKTFQLEGIQFHPESILTGEGKNIIKNWVSH